MEPKYYKNIKVIVMRSIKQYKMVTLINFIDIHLKVLSFGFGKDELKNLIFLVLDNIKEII